MPTTVTNKFRTLTISTLLALTLCFSGFAQAAETLALTPGQSLTSFAESIQFIEVPDGERDIATIKQRYLQGEFQPIASPHPNFGLSRSQFWLRLQLRSDVSTESQWVLSLGKAYLRLARVYIERDGNTTLLLADGSQTRFSERVNDNRLISTNPFPLAGNETATLWIHYASDVSTALPITIDTPEQFTHRTLKTEVSLAIYYAIAAAMSIFIVAMAIVLRAKVALLYAVYFVLILVFNAQVNGALFSNLWPEAPQFNAVFAHPVTLGVVFFALLFGHEFIAFDAAPRYARFLTLTVAAACLICLFLPLIADMYTVRKLTSLLTLIMIAVQTNNAIIAFKHKRPGAGFFLAATLVLVLYIGSYALLLIFLPVADGSRLYDYARYGQLIDGAIYMIAVLQITRVLRKREQSAVAHAENLDLELERTRHDARQPLLTLKSTLRQLNQSEASHDTEIRQRLSQSIEYLETLLAGQNQARSANIPDVSTADSNAPASVADIIDSVLIMFSADAQQKAISLQRDGDDGASLTGSVALLRVLSNLVSNAIAHSNARTIAITLKHERHAPQIVICDDGNGMPVPPGVNSPAAGKKEHQRGGMGLGIVRELCAQNGWRIDMQSTPAAGTVFTIAGLQSTH